MFNSTHHSATYMTPWPINIQHPRLQQHTPTTVLFPKPASYSSSKRLSVLYLPRSYKTRWHTFRVWAWPHRSLEGTRRTRRVKRQTCGDRCDRSQEAGLTSVNASHDQRLDIFVIFKSHMFKVDFESISLDKGMSLCMSKQLTVLITLFYQGNCLIYQLLTNHETEFQSSKVCTLQLL